MSAHTLYSEFARKSVMYCSTTGRAFGPVFDNADAADFVDWMLNEHDRDPRDMNDNTLDIWVASWQKEINEEEAS